MTQDQKPAPDWQEIEIAYKAGLRSVNSLAKEWGITEGAIRAKAKKLGWVRDPGDTKRAIVSDHMAGVTNGTTTAIIRTIEDAAREDIADMERGLRINRMCLINLEASAGESVEPREIKIIVEATSAAIDSIRKIRGLDQSASNDKVPSLEDFYGDLAPEPEPGA